MGYHNWSTISRDSIKDSIVNNNGDRTGGFVGLLQNGTISVSSVDNVIINGKKSLTLYQRIVLVG